MPAYPISHPLALERLRDARTAAGDIDILAAAIAIATHIHPTIQPAKIHQAFDRFVQDVRHMAGKGNPPHVALRHVLSLRHGFVGNRRDYKDPRNSYIDTVLERRTGLPILLALVYVETARRDGHIAHGIGLPGHFIAAFDLGGDAASRIYIDAFNHGVELSMDACRRVGLDSAGVWNDEYLEPVDPAYWVLRMLENLRSTYVEMGDPANTAAVLEQMLVLDPANAAAARELQAAYQVIDGQSAKNN